MTTLVRPEVHSHIPLSSVEEGPSSSAEVIAIYGKGGIGKSFTLCKPLLHDGGAG